MTPALAAPAIARDAFHSIRRTAPYKPGLLRPWPGRKAPGDTSADVRTPLRLRRADHDQGAER
jgi:hypothetical protein